MLGSDFPSPPRIPIAIVGASCRLPGAESIRQYWDLLASGRDMISGFPTDRQKFLPSRYSGKGGFLDQIDGFDAPFFEMSPYEAVRVDPHQRLLMETAWEAVEDAGLSAESLAGSRTGGDTSWFGT